MKYNVWAVPAVQRDKEYLWQFEQNVEYTLFGENFSLTMKNWNKTQNFTKPI